MNEARPVTAFNRIAYAIGDFYGGGGFFLVSTFAMFFLVNVAGLTGTEVGLLFGLSKIWDAFTDPFMGWLSDRTRARMGRRRIWFLVGLVPIFLSFLLIWYPAPLAGHTAKFIYYLGAYLFFYTVSTMVQVPYSALAADMTNDPKERNGLVGMRLMFSMGSTLLIGLLAQPFIDSFHDPALGHKALGVAGGLFCSLPFILVLLGTWELPHEEAKSEYSNFARNFLSIFRNRAFLVQLGMYVAAYTAMDILMAWMKFYVNDYLGMPKFLSVGLGVLILAEIASVSFYKRILDRKGAGAAYSLGLAIFVAGMALFYFQTPDPAFRLVSAKTLIIAFNCALLGFGLGAGVYIPYALLPYSIDADELITGDKRSGTYAGGMTLFRKLIQGGIVLPLLGVLLDAIGYRSAASASAAAAGSGAAQTGPVLQSASTLQSLHLLFILLPIVLVVLGVLVTRAFRMSPENHAVMVAELERLRAGGSKDEAPEATRRLCERLTGQEWARLWGGNRT